MKWQATEDGGVAEGVEFLGFVEVPAEEVPGALYAYFAIAPGEFGGTRLALKSEEYQKFCFEELDFMYVPGVGSDTPGAVILAFDRDISNPQPPVSEQGVRQLLAFQDAKSGSVWKDKVAKCPKRAQKDMLFCQPAIGGDDRLAYQGQFYAACQLPTGEAEGTALGSIVVKYKCRFAIAALNDDNEVADVEVATAIPNGASDTFDLVQAGTELVTGDQEYTPKNFGDGTWGLLLREGLYRFTEWLTSSVYTGAGTASFDPITVELLEPSSAGPSFELEALNAQTSDASGGNPVRDYYVSVPRGGARLRSTMAFTGTLAASAASLIYNVVRMGGFVSGLSNLVGASSAVKKRVQQKFQLMMEAALLKDPKAKVVISGPLICKGPKMHKLLAPRRVVSVAPAASGNADIRVAVPAAAVRSAALMPGSGVETLVPSMTMDQLAQLQRIIRDRMADGAKSSS
jgi:hypothetical protein